MTRPTEAWSQICSTSIKIEIAMPRSARHERDGRFGSQAR
jgi:hypothetical protein